MIFVVLLLHLLTQQITFCQEPHLESMVSVAPIRTLAIAFRLMYMMSLTLTHSKNG